MTRRIIIVALCLVALAACRRGADVKAATAGAAVGTDVGVSVPPSAAGGGATFEGAARVEALLRAAGVPYHDRYDLYPSAFLDGCVWLAVYESDPPAVVLETFIFQDVKAAEDYVTNRHADFSAAGGDVERMLVNNGAAVLVAWYKAGPGDDGKMGAMQAFAGAFATAK